MIHATAAIMRPEVAEEAYLPHPVVRALIMFTERVQAGVQAAFRAMGRAFLAAGGGEASDG